MAKTQTPLPRRLGVRPRVCGCNMADNDHPQGGGTGNPDRGFPKRYQGIKTRKTWLNSWQLIIKRRRVGYGMDPGMIRRKGTATSKNKKKK